MNMRYIHVCFRSAVVAGGLVLMFYLFLVDYPPDTPVWEVLIWDRAGWLHEEFYVLVFILAAVALSAWYEWQKTLQAALNAYLGLGAEWLPPVYKVRRIKRKGP